MPPSSSCSTRSSPQAVEEGASDIHLEPDGRELRVRFRVDGVLASTATVPRRMVGGIVSRAKIMAELDISERRLPQDGRVGMAVDGRAVDIRVVTLPTVHGEAQHAREEHHHHRGPVEYQLDGLTQIQVNPRAGLNFSSGLRSMMRADPDIIMVGEIRDRDTAHPRLPAHGRPT